MALKKSDILRTTKGSEEMEIEGLGPVLLRPLSEGEYQKSQAMILTAVSAITSSDVLRKRKPGTDLLDDVEVRFDLGELTKGEFEANSYIASCGLSTNGEKWTVEEIKSISPPGFIEKIAREVCRISGVGGDIEDLIGSFRQKPGGAGSVVIPQDGHTNRKRPK
jgi:hypothetical protein